MMFIIAYNFEWVSILEEDLEEIEGIKKRLFLVFWAENQARRAQYGQSFSLLIIPIENLQ